MRNPTLLTAAVLLFPVLVSAQLGEGFGKAQGVLQGRDGGGEIPGVGRIRDVALGGGAAAKPAAPDFTLTDLKGAKMRLSAHKGKVVVLDFFATWCDHCKKSTPWLVGRSKEGVVVLGIAVDSSEDKATLAKYVQDYAIPYQIAVDEKGSLGNTPAYASRGIPTFVIVGKDGAIRSKIIGFLKDDLDAAMKAALAE
ncbi:MAG: TlpA family protein disulfide reductase [Elusimicrobia bacterium]|nr:TlpA family protein disulfide reductase [Elusimicrobiota bacterium]